MVLSVLIRILYFFYPCIILNHNQTSAEVEEIKYWVIIDNKLKFNSNFELLLFQFQMFIAEYINHRGKKNHKVHHFLGVRIPPWVWSSYNVVGVFGFGVACQQLTTDIAKYTVGRLRPHFFDVSRDIIIINKGMVYTSRSPYTQCL